MNELFRTLLGLPEQASSVALGIDVLHYVVIGISILGATGVAIAVAVLLYRFRWRQKGHPQTHRARVPVWVEAMTISGLLAMFLVFWVIGFRQFVELRTPPRDAMPIYVVAKQWMWTFAYADGSATTSDVYVPVGRPVKLVMTSRDVIHSFYVPEFRVKQDVVPGQTSIIWFEATKPGPRDVLCAEYCGTEHSRMRGRVIALAEADYARWADSHRAPGDDLASAGARIAADRGCLRCHTVDGTPHLGPSWARLYGSTITMQTGERVRVDEAYLTESMMDPERRVHAGFAPIMPTYRGLLAGGEVAALVEFIRSLAERTIEWSPLPVGTTATSPSLPARAQ
ncbi:MAG: c-type cytochrome [Kofleriaceae bacterium]